ncbi:MAG TPA: hypothetical protein VOA41_15390 [Candidatus Dormibacteraeota bacterium]|nr:hypothetical protein [Candidatus Dormibacteraeota bacterium]
MRNRKIKTFPAALPAQPEPTHKTEPRGDLRWIAALSEPYLRGYPPRKVREEELQGYWFVAPETAVKQRLKNHRNKRLQAPYGFFVGYIRSAGKYGHLKLEVPECSVFAWFAEPGGAEHARLVEAPGSLLRKTHIYIGWLTHRAPRFALYTDQFITLVRHRTMLDWPEAKRAHYSRNFFIETLAWLVRSGLVKKLKSGEGTGLEV